MRGPPPSHNCSAANKDVIVAVGCGVGCVQLFDVRMMDSFVTLQDPVAGSIHQVKFPCVRTCVSAEKTFRNLEF